MVSFCSTLPQLQAHLAIHGIRKTLGGDTDAVEIDRMGPPTLAILNPLRLHRGTPSLSAQGLSRTFASAVEGAVRASQKLLIAECPSRVPNRDIQTDEHGDFGAEEQDVAGMGGAEGEEAETQDPWEQQVAILNVTTKSFGAGERGWVGRTVKTKRVAERWCAFRKLD